MTALDTRLGPLAAGFVRAVFRDRKAILERETADNRHSHDEALQDAGRWATLIDTGVLVCEGWEVVESVKPQGVNEGGQLSGNFEQLGMM